MSPPLRRGYGLFAFIALLVSSATLPASAVASETIDTHAGTGAAGPIGAETPRLEANFEGPAFLDGGGAGAMVADGARIRSVNSQTVWTYLGTGTPGFAGDGGSREDAVIGVPGGIARLPEAESAVVYFTDPATHRIRMVDTLNIVRTFAGDGTAGDSGDGGPAADARLDTPTALVSSYLNHTRSLFVVTGHRVRQIRLNPQSSEPPSGVIAAFAGTGAAGFSGDGGPAGSARLDSPGALAVAPDGTLYIADNGNFRIRRVTPQGIITTVAGTGVAGSGGLGGPAAQAQLEAVSALALDQQGRLYIAQAGQHRVLRITSDGRLEQYVGTGTAGFSGDGGPVREARLNQPSGLAVDFRNQLWIADKGNRRIRITSPLIADGATVPEAPGLPRAYSGVGSASVEVDPPADGGMPILEYIYEATPADVPPEVSYLPRKPIYGLQNGRTYTFTVRARNAVGVGPPSAPTNEVVPLQSMPVLSAPDAQAVEGNAGQTVAQMVFRLGSPAVIPVEFAVRSNGGSATPGVDYAPVPLTPLRIEVGQTEVALPVTIFGDTTREQDETIEFDWEFGISGARRETPLTRRWKVVVRDDDAPAPLEIVLRDDRVLVKEGSGPNTLLNLDNDDFDRARLTGGSLAVVAPPAKGTATADDGGTPASAVDDVLRYQPAANASGQDQFSYRVCLSGGVCSEATVFVMIRPHMDEEISTQSTSGFRDILVYGLREMPSATYRSTPLVAPVTVRGFLAQDPSLHTPWDGSEGRRVELRTLPPHAGAEPREWQVLVDAGDVLNGTAIDLYLGIDDNGDGQASQDELRCAAVTGAAVERCEIALTQAAGEQPVYWAMVHNRGIPTAPVRMDIYEVPMSGAGGKLVATGPGHADAGEASGLRVAWDDATLLEGETRVAYIGLSADDGDPMGSFPVRVQRTGNVQEGIVLANGESRALALAPGESHDAIIVDVPLGATRLTVETSSGQNVDLYLSPSPGSGGGPASRLESVLSAPTHAAVGPTGNETIVVSGSALTPGRWYLSPYNPGTEAATLQLRATVEANAPAVRPGSYFNADRSGHGLFLYPAGDQWAGLWYTYLEDGDATWYYLQAPAPGLDGSWASPIYRASWNGARNGLTEIGHATVTPTGADGFLFSFTLDGHTGSEAMAPLGRGCPSLGGQPVDASSHWFNPASAGSGYSVQLFPNYEFHAAFIYDNRGQPRFVAAERNGFGGAQADIPVERLRGFCPTCPRLEEPTRFDAGVLGRTISQGKLTGVSLDVVFEGTLWGAWSADEPVQLLGGPGSTQGCAP